MRAGLIFDAIIEQAKLLDKCCTDPRPTPYILAIKALAQAGWDELMERAVKPQQAPPRPRLVKVAEE
jgi:hypothetical protein